MALFARAAVDGGAGGIRANGAEDVRDIRAAVDVPILAIHKEWMDDEAILITPTFERARELAEAGADAIALDCTARGARYGALERLQRIKREIQLPVMADIATLEEADAAARAGADFVLSTMRGFTAETMYLPSGFEPEFIAELARRAPVPVIAEGRIWRPQEARAAMEAGAWAVVVGSAITRPQEITRRFAEAVESGAAAGWMAAIDFGATNIKAGFVSPRGEVEGAFMIPTAKGGRKTHLEQLRRVARRLAQNAKHPLGLLAVATAGWVDSATGEIQFSTGNLEYWTGAQVGGALTIETGLLTLVENDAICAAAGEWLYGAARGARNALCVTLGTGIGAGAIVEGRLARGAHGLAQMLGHIPLAGSERECNCGLRGCVEAETKAALGKGGEGLPGYARWLARGLVPAIHLLDPEVVVLAGGIAAAAPELGEMVGRELAVRTLAWDRRRVAVRISDAAEYAGVRGAAAMGKIRIGEGGW
jgi:putative N-acetylmannosamine-6-phosphate epimerase/predicted NBD/HSP70 family sugar kinase